MARRNLGWHSDKARGNGRSKFSVPSKTLKLRGKFSVSWAAKVHRHRSAGGTEQLSGKRAKPQRLRRVAVAGGKSSISRIAKKGLAPWKRKPPRKNWSCWSSKITARCATL